VGLKTRQSLRVQGHVRHQELEEPEKSAEEELDASTWSEDGPSHAHTSRYRSRDLRSMRGLSRREAKRLVDSVIEEMIGTLTQGETLKLHDFGSFIVRSKGERPAAIRAPEPKCDRARKVVVSRLANMKSTVNGEGPPKAHYIQVVRKSAMKAAYRTP